MKPTLGLRASQQLTLTPQLQQSIRLLQLSTLELTQEIERAIADNPLLELEDDDSEEHVQPLSSDERMISDELWAADEAAIMGTSDATAEDPPQDWDGDGSVEIFADATDWGCDAPSVASEGDADSFEPRSTTHLSLESHLRDQASCVRVTDLERACLEALIRSLDDSGFLTQSIDVLSEDLMPESVRHADTEQREIWRSAWATALALLQSFDPVGVGARNVWECLELQARAKGRSGEWDREATELVLAMLQCAPELLAKRDIKRLCALTQLDEQCVRNGLLLLRQLNPWPANAFAALEAEAVIPDLIVSKRGRGWRVDLNPDVVPRLRVSRLAQELGGGGPWQAKVQEARWFAKSVQQRFDTILSVGAAIVERQHAFFSHGAMAMQPLVLRDIADSLGLHESTVSRVTTAKYMACPLGVFELKYFFGSSLSTAHGASTSSTAVKALIQRIVDTEDRTRPLSDSDIAEILKREGVACARRTVAKYRETLKIAPASLRAR